MNKREKNKVIIRKRLLKEALFLFSTKGFENTTIDEIVIACNIAKGTFYNYYTDARALLDGVTNQINIEIQLAIQESRKNSTCIYDFLYTSFKGYFDYVSRDDLINFFQKNHSYIRSVSYNRHTIKLIITDLEEALKSQKLRTKFKNELHLRLLTMIFMSAASDLFLNIQTTEEAISNDEMAAFLADLFSKGLEE